MGSLSGIIQRPVIAASVVAIASVSTDLQDKLRPNKSLHSEASSSSSSVELSNSVLPNQLQEQKSSSWVSWISASKLADFSYVNRSQIPLPNIKRETFNSGFSPISGPSSLLSSIVSSPVLANLYQSAELVKAAKPAVYAYTIPPSSASDVLYKWHLPQPNAVEINGVSSDCSKSRTVVVLLGWLGAKQKHLNRYAEWYASRGFHAITFTFSMAEILSYQVGGKAEQEVGLLANHLADWLEEEDGKNLVFHTFSNTGWLTYGVILEKFQSKDPTLIRRIKGCVVDSAPVAAPDPEVWASGFSAALLKKNSVATKGLKDINNIDATTDQNHVLEVQPELTEAVLMVVLKKVFQFVLNLPTVNRRLSDVLSLLTSQQPSCPQLYIYSSADKVIPSGSVESFIDGQRRNGREVRSCNFISTPHVDHFRNDPSLYTSQLTKFFDDCVLTCSKDS